MGNGLTKEEREFIKDREDRRISRDPMYAIQAARKANKLPAAPQSKPPGSRKDSASPPSARAGNYRAPVDTSGMDPEMVETLGIKRKK